MYNFTKTQYSILVKTTKQQTILQKSKIMIDDMVQVVYIEHVRDTKYRLIVQNVYYVKNNQE